MLIFFPCHFIGILIIVVAVLQNTKGQNIDVDYDLKVQAECTQVNEITISSQQWRNL